MFARFSTISSFLSLLFSLPESTDLAHSPLPVSSIGPLDHNLLRLNNEFSVGF